MTDFEKLREQVVTLIEPHLRVYEGNRSEAERVADRILAIPAIADVLRMKPIQTMRGSSESA